MIVAILKNSSEASHLNWEKACKSAGIDYKIVELKNADFLDRIININPDFCLAQPPGATTTQKNMYDERIYSIKKYLNIPVFPSWHEIILHENKKALFYFLKSNQIAHPTTFLSYNKAESLEFIYKTKYPIVAKTSIGAASSGVKIIQNKKEGLTYLNKAFGGGIKRRFGPNRKTGSPKSWLLKAFRSPDYFMKKVKEYSERNKDSESGYVLFQEYIEHNFEWRCVKIGESFFAYKKLKIGQQASGAKQFDYDAPPIELLDFTRNLCEKHDFNFMAVDMFYTGQKIYVNELQTIFGHKSPYICKVNGKPGRYTCKNDKWLFEEGNFNTNESYDLRIETAINLFNKDRTTSSLKK